MIFPKAALTMMLVAIGIVVQLFVVLQFKTDGVAAFVLVQPLKVLHRPTLLVGPVVHPATLLFEARSLREDDDDDDSEKEISDALQREQQQVNVTTATTTTDVVVKVDDGGSNLTDRFKYKVNALMGVFDPPTPDQDTERQDGNIMNALLTFPTTYTFHVVGKVALESTDGQAFVDQVQSVVDQATGDTVVVSARPRGTKFTKVTVEAMVDSATIITQTYQELDALEWTIMKF